MKRKPSQGRSGSRGENNDRSRPASGKSWSPRSTNRDSRPARAAKPSAWDDFDRETAPRGPSRTSDRPERAENDRVGRGRAASGAEGKGAYQRRDDREEKRPYKRRDDREERKPYGDREEKRPYQRRDDREERKPYGDREEKRPYQRRDDREERKPYGDREEKRPYQRRDDREERKPYGDREEKRPYQRRDDREERKPYGDREEKRPYTKREGGSSRRPSMEDRHAHFEKRAGSRGSYGRGGDRRAAPRKRSASQGPDLSGEIRLNRFIGMAGIGSRREADDLITAGLITVNGKLVTELGTKVKPGDDVRYNGERIRNEKHVYLLLNKPKDYITTAEDPNDRKTVMELISGACPERIYPVGRLDRNTTGLLLFTNDGDLARHLTHPSSQVKKIYQVELDKNVKVADMKKLLEGVELEDGISSMDEVSYQGDGTDKKSVGVELHSGKNRIVRRMFETLGYEVKKLDRVGFAGLTKKDLPRGRWRMLEEKEIGFLKMMGTGKKKYKAD
ncbi:MAG: pseudouridine synthase [Bacteroidia bacterium]|nr:pseudouridine synthase [Bacteroidia bacterium]